MEHLPTIDLIPLKEDDNIVWGQSLENRRMILDYVVNTNSWGSEEP